VGHEPGDLSRVAGRKAWLKWWYEIQQEITTTWGTINQLISPNSESDRWLKFVAKETGLEVSCRDPAVRAVPNHKDYKEVLGLLGEYYAGLEDLGGARRGERPRETILR